MSNHVFDKVGHFNFGSRSGCVKPVRLPSNLHGSHVVRLYMITTFSQNIIDTVKQDVLVLLDCIELCAQPWQPELIDWPNNEL